MWGPNTPPDNQMYYYGVSSNMYYGKVLVDYSWAGEIMALDPQTGEQLWTWNATTTPYESPYGDNQPVFISVVCDGKIYTYTSEHSPTKPNWRGSYIHCINATDGTQIWKLANYAVFLTGYGIADGYIVTASDYDNLIYCIGKGPSATTVSAPQTGMPAGSTYVITGTVNDISPGAMTKGPNFGYTNGIPAISDEDQEAWMEYIYEQQAKPSDATGVPVSIDAIDPNNNFIHIGDAVTDATGTFGYSWTTPDVPGLYRIIVSFEGSSSYGSSSASTFTYVTEAPQASPTPTPPPPSMAGTYIISFGTAIIIIIIVGFAILILRKR